MSQDARVSVIIPVWNLWPMTAASLRSLAAHSAGENMEVVVVDNASTDATVAELEPLGRALFGASFRVLRMAENVGFARGCNAGARACNGDLVFFLNNDTTVTPGWLPPLRAALLASERMGAVGPLLLYPDTTVQHCGVCISPFSTLGHLYEHFPGKYPAARNRHPLQAITGAAMLLRRTVFADCGGFHEEYRNGFEDVDLCFTLRARGLKLAVESAGVIFHHTSQTPGRFDHDTHNSQVLLRRYAHSLRPDLHLLAALDGYRLCLGPTLKFWLALPVEEEQRRNRELGGENFCEDRCRRELEREPLWRGGWLLLAEHLEKENRQDEALAVMARCARYFPEHDVLLHLLRLGRKSADNAEQIAQNVAQGISPPPHAGARVRWAKNQARVRGDAALEKLLDHWLALHGKDARAPLPEKQ